MSWLIPYQEDTSMSADGLEKGDMVHRSTQNPQETYEIKVQGQLDSLWAQWFEGMKLSEVENGESGVACTLISGPVADQPALHGLLIKIRDLNLKLISIRMIKPGASTSVEVPIPPEPS